MPMYYAHANETEVNDCGNLHMRYDAEKDMGYFGERVKCRDCRGDSSSSSDSDSESDHTET